MTETKLINELFLLEKKITEFRQRRDIIIKKLYDLRFPSDEIVCVQPAEKIAEQNDDSCDGETPSQVPTECAVSEERDFDDKDIEHVLNALKSTKRGIERCRIKAIFTPSRIAAFEHLVKEGSLYKVSINAHTYYRLEGFNYDD